MISRTISPQEKPLFRFVVISDTHVTAEWDRSTSPFPSVAKANRRTAAAVARIKSLQPDFVLHLGDMVHPVPGQPGFAPAVGHFKDIWRDLGVPLHLIPGNHDIGDKPSGWLPAPPVSAETQSIYDQTFGPDRQVVEYGGCRFVMIDSSLINSGLPEEEEQWAWLDANLPHSGRNFLCLHYPPFLFDPNEPDHYDNLANPGRARLLSLLRGRAVEGIFSGHVHNVFLNRIHGADAHVLPAIAFIRHDYTQLFPVPPVDPEFGRTHEGRFGFLLVQVFSEGHTVHWVHTFGQTDPSNVAETMPVSMLHPRHRSAHIGVNLRHEWARPLAIAPAGGVDELSRKYVRNDYITMRLQSLGLRNLRVPMQDVVDPVAAARMMDLAAFGHRFTVYGFGLPTPEVADRLAAVSPAIEALEVILPPGELRAQVPDAERLRRALGIPLMLSKLELSAHSEGGHNAVYNHFIRQGFSAREAADALADIAKPDDIDGLCFRIERPEPLWPAITRIAETLRGVGKRGVVHLRLANENAVKWGGTLENTASRIAEATLANWAFGDVLTIFIDTFIDLDRGYFPRTGLIDPLCELQPAGAALQRLAELLSQQPGGGQVTADGTARRFSVAGLGYALLLSEAGEAYPMLEVQGATIRLDTGKPIPENFSKTA